MRGVIPRMQLGRSQNDAVFCILSMYHVDTQIIITIVTFHQNSVLFKKDVLNIANTHKYGKVLLLPCI